ncbi:MAG TPA: alpha/beta fold hydrolase [Mycobacteriales bacterium]|nr:alpha/beta fold hydrolase [Mycobacteriales bacterium]
MRRRTLAAVAAAAVLLLAGGAAVTALTGPPEVTTSDAEVEAGPEPSGEAVRLATTTFRPAGRGVLPAVLLAHGFGGSKDSVAGEARRLAEQGFHVVTWSARGFGGSGGRIHLDSPDYEVRDAAALVQLLSTLPDRVAQDGPGDPRVGVVGASYGGALALLLAGADPRVDAIVPMITWNELGQALFPQSATLDELAATPAGVRPAADPGVFKKSWAGNLFAAAGRGGGPPGCGRFDPAVCAAYQASAAQGAPTAELTALMAASSPARVLDRVRAPTLLVQGESDSLFPLREGDANARGIAATGTPVRTVWYGGGHDGGPGETDRLRELTVDWLRTWLRPGPDRPAATPAPAFSVSVVTPRSDGAPDDIAVRTAPGLPGASGAPAPARTGLPLLGPAQTVAAPAGGTPATVTGLPGLGALAQLGAAATAATSPPGGSALFTTAPLRAPLRLVGSPTVELRVTSTAPDLTLFASVYDDPGDGRSAVLPQQLVSPVRVAVPAGGRTVRVVLPAVVRDVAAGHALRLVISTTDAAYALPSDARTYEVSLAGDAALSLPVVPTAATAGRSWLLPAAVGAGVLLAVVLALVVLRRRRAVPPPDPALLDVPLVLQGLGKTYANGFQAVTDLSFRVERGQVLGLLGPNGAGKTTALRMVLGLLQPTSGAARVFGFAVQPGAPVLSRIGAFVEGPGLLPHLSGRQNLELHWQSTGRPADQSYLAEALEVSGLGDDLERRVGTYSQGMRQRLAIAQAMLGLPELLVLDEPTNGLDPPQIREMREVLRRYADTGRTVLVSSHLLGEVEQTCTHAVVMTRGRLVAGGPVAGLVGSATALVLDVDDVELAVRVLDDVPGVQDVRRTEAGLTLRLVGTPRAELARALVGAGVGIDRLAPQRGLEEAFLALVGEG